MTVQGAQYGDNNTQHNHFMAEPARLPREAYLHDVRKLAPPELLQREADLAELARFCRGDGRYVWWRARPWTGKTALMATFVLHPPDDVEIFHFFVSSAGATADSGVFTEKLIEQMAAYLGDFPVSSDRSAVLRKLVIRAAERAVQDGRRMIILVDGLDEDRSNEYGHNLPSILMTLMGLQGPRLGIVVAGRLNSDLPIDVTDVDHPIFRCSVRTLAPVDAVRSMEREANLELHTIMHGMPLVRTMLGFIVAAAFPLTSEELAELAGTDVDEVEDLIVTTAGRILASYLSFSGGCRYGFAHETLQAKAMQRFGAKQLAERTRIIHTWADVYRGQGWPETTPGYLLFGYPTMLAVHQDTDRLVGLALDGGRHVTMRSCAGGDGQALQEVAQAQYRLAEQEDPDPRTVALLAREHARLRRPSRAIPLHLPAVWALLGDVPRAIGLRSSMVDANDVVVQEADVLLFRAVLGAGDLMAAERLVWSLEDPAERASRMLTIVTACVDAGHLELAESFALSVDDAELREDVLIEYTGVLTRADLFAEAAATAAGLVANPDDARMRIVRELLEMGEAERAIALLPSIEGQMERALATMMISDDRVDSELWDQAQPVMMAMLNTPDRDTAESAARFVAVALARCGAVDDAEQMLRAISDQDLRNDAYDQVLESFVMMGYLDPAEQLAAAPPPGHEDRKARRDLIELLVTVDEVDRAVRVALETSDTPLNYRRVPDPSAREKPRLNPRVEDLSLVVRALAETAHPRVDEVFSRAEGLARTILDDKDRYSALGTLALTAAHIGDTGRAQRLLQESRKVRPTAAALARAGNVTLTRLALELMAERDEGLAGTIWAMLAERLAAERRDEDVRDVLPDALAAARAEPELRGQGELLAQLALAAATVGQNDVARSAALEAEAATREVRSEDEKDLERFLLVLSLGRTSDLPRAAAILSEGDSDRKREGLEALAGDAIRSRDFPRALAAAELAHDDELWLDIARLASRDDVGTARTATQRIGDPTMQAQGWAAVADVLLDAGLIDQARPIVLGAADLVARAPHAAAAGEVAAPAVRLGLPHVADELSRPYQRPDFLSRYSTALARRLAEHGEHVHARAALETATSSAQKVRDPARRSELLVEAIAVWAELGDAETVRRLTDTVIETPGYDRIIAGVWLLGPLAQVGATDLAIAISKECSDNPDDLAYLAGVLALHGRYDEAESLAFLAPESGGMPQSKLHPDGQPSHRDEALRAAVDAIADTDELARAEPLVEHIVHPPTRVAAMTSLITAHARAGNERRARQLLAQAWIWGRWAEPLLGLSAIAPEVVVEILTGAEATA